MLNKNELSLVKEAIRDAESCTSAEIRVCVAKRCSQTALEAAYRKFEKLKMYETALRNAVLIYVAPADKKMAIVGDAGINKIIPPHFWDNVLSDMLPYFANDNICEGLCFGVQKVGELIKEHYPIGKEDRNELGDEVIMDESDEE